MQLSQSIVGRWIVLRNVQEKDAEYILKLRLDPAYSRFIHVTDPNVETQRKWIRSKLEAKNDCHMIIEDFKGKELGTVAIYNIDFAVGTFEWGRWIIEKDAPLQTAIESMILIYEYAFSTLHLEKAIFGVQNSNSRVAQFHRATGAIPIREDDRETWFAFTKKDFEMLREHFVR